MLAALCSLAAWLGAALVLTALREAEWPLALAASGQRFALETMALAGASLAAQLSVLAWFWLLEGAASAETLATWSLALPALAAGPVALGLVLSRIRALRGVRPAALLLGGWALPAILGPDLDPWPAPTTFLLRPGAEGALLAQMADRGPAAGFALAAWLALRSAPARR